MKNRWVSAIGLCLILLFAVLPVGLGFLFQFVDFTYGTAGLDPEAFRQRLQLLPLVGLGALLVDVLFRRLFLRTLMRKMVLLPACILYLLALQILWILPPLRSLIFHYEVSFLGMVVYHTMMQLLLGIYMVWSGRWIFTAFCHLLIQCLQWVVLQDVSGGIDTLYYFSVGDPRWYWAFLVVPAFLLMLFLSLLYRDRNEHSSIQRKGAK